MQVLVVRGDDQKIRAFPNTCLHRGRALKDRAGRSDALRCRFHGWTWNLDGSLKEVPCRWDFPHVEQDDYHLRELPTGTWGGFVFINMDPSCESFESYMKPAPTDAGR